MFNKLEDRLKKVGLGGNSSSSSSSNTGTGMTGPAALGILIVGLGGNNGVTMLAGLRANHLGLEWEAPTGKIKANYLGCITQLPMKGGKGGYKETYALADANRAAIGGWDIRPTPLGDALYASHVLDYDLVRQVREPLNKIEIMKGVWNPSFIGETQHATATHVIDHASTTHAQSLALLRADIQRFRTTHQIPPTGHITVTWSASVERPTLRDFSSAASLLSAIEVNDPEVSPSLLYAVAACLEGCSFVNGGSQNTLCPGLTELAAAQAQGKEGGKEGGRCYVLGTDFKAGQTKFKTAAVEYIRALGLTPTVIASSNHLGNNDMLNLTSKKTLDAKMRVKSDIFAGWEEHGVDHQVRVMYTPFIGDEKRDIVEYTSLGFLGSPHTMLTYTRCMDSILCVPLMLDVAVWCDYFARKNLSPEQAALATAYLFKVPEGAAKGADPGFFHQMDMLEKVLEGTISSSMPPALRMMLARQYTTAAKAEAQAQKAQQEKGEGGGSEGGKGGMEGGDDEPWVGGVVCVGLSCLDLMLLGASGEGEAFGAINTFQKQVFCPGGSAPQSSLALAEMLHGLGGREGGRGKRRSVVKVLTKVGEDVHGEELLRQMEEAGVDTSLVMRDSKQCTSLAVLPILATTGARGCFVNLQANDSFTPTEALEALREGGREGGLQGVAALHFGYPHLMKQFQGTALREFFQEAAGVLNGGGGGGGSAGTAAMRRSLLLSMDLNGVTTSNNQPSVLAEAFPWTDVLHLNQEEANLLLSGNDSDIHLSDAAISLSSLQQAADALLAQGLAIVALTLGEHGAYVKVTSNEKRLQASEALAWQGAKWAGQETLLPPYPLQAGAEVNTNGAGDAFIGGFLAAMLCKTKSLSLKQATSFALLTARERVDSLRRVSPTKASYAELLGEALKVT